MPSFEGKGSADSAGLHFFNLSWQKGEAELTFTKPSLCPPWDQALARSQIITLITRLCPSLFLLLTTQSCLTLWDPTDCSPPGSSVHGILQARIPWSPPGDLPDSGIKPTSLAWQDDFYFFFFHYWATWEVQQCSYPACFSFLPKWRKKTPNLRSCEVFMKELLTPSRWGLGGTGLPWSWGAFSGSRENQSDMLQVTYLSWCAYVRSLINVKWAHVGF